MTRHLAWAVALLAGSACESFFTAPEAGGPDVQLTLSGPVAAASSYGDLGPALRDVRFVRLRLAQTGSLRDTLVAGSVVDGVFHARVSLRAQEAGDWLEVQAELRMQNQLPLFRGHALILSNAVAPTAVIDLSPVAYEIQAPPPGTRNALGDTTVLGGTAHFANSIAIVGAEVLWQSSNPAVVEVIDGRRMVARANGSATLTGTALGASLQRFATVRQVPTSLTGIGPADTTIAVNASFSARAFGEDSNGYPLLPGAFVQWSGRGVVTVAADGTVRATGTGTGFIDATLGTITHTAQVTVVP